MVDKNLAWDTDVDDVSDDLQSHVTEFEAHGADGPLIGENTLNTALDGVGGGIDIYPTQSDLPAGTDPLMVYVEEDNGYFKRYYNPNEPSSDWIWLPEGEFPPKDNTIYNNGFYANEWDTYPEHVRSTYSKESDHLSIEIDDTADGTLAGNWIYQTPIDLSEFKEIEVEWEAPVLDGFVNIATHETTEYGQFIFNQQMEDTPFSRRVDTVDISDEDHPEAYLYLRLRDNAGFEPRPGKLMIYRASLIPNDD